MYLMTIPDGEGLIATQRYYNLLKTMYTYGMDDAEGVVTRLQIGDFVVSHVHTAVTETVDGEVDECVRVDISFVVGDDVFLVDRAVHTNKAWDVWVASQPVRCQVIEKDAFVGELIEFFLDYYPDFEV